MNGDRCENHARYTPERQTTDCHFDAPTDEIPQTPV